MKKTTRIALLVCLALLACTLVFTACDGGNEPQTPSGMTDGTTVGTTEPGTDAHVHSFGEPSRIIILMSATRVQPSV